MNSLLRGAKNKIKIVNIHTKLGTPAGKKIKVNFLSFKENSFGFLPTNVKT